MRRGELGLRHPHHPAAPGHRGRSDRACSAQLWGDSPERDHHGTTVLGPAFHTPYRLSIMTLLALTEIPQVCSSSSGELHMSVINTRGCAGGDLFIDP